MRGRGESQKESVFIEQNTCFLFVPIIAQAYLIPAVHRFLGITRWIKFIAVFLAVPLMFLEAPRLVESPRLVEFPQLAGYLQLVESPHQQEEIGESFEVVELLLDPVEQWARVAAKLSPQQLLQE